MTPATRLQTVKLPFLKNKKQRGNNVGFALNIYIKGPESEI